MKRFLIILLCLIGSLFVVLFIPDFRHTSLLQPSGEQTSEIGIFNQKIEYIDSSPNMIHSLYRNGELLGVIFDEKELERHLKTVYEEKYESTYPDSRVYLDKDMYITDEKSYFRYTNADEEIINYIDSNQLYSLEATAVSFSDETDVFARIFVISQEIYEEAMNEYLSIFIDPTALNRITAGETISDLTTFGSQDIGISIAQTISTTREYADIDEILTTKEEVLEYLQYGENTEREYYTVQKFDTVAGVGAKNNGLSATQIMNINRDKIFSTDQVLSEGEELCVTYFTSPLEITVYKQELRERPIYYETSYVEDDQYLIGERKVTQEGVNGSRNVLYSQKWVNGVLLSGTEISSVLISGSKE